MPSEIDSCVFFNDDVITTLHVDDLLLTANDKKKIEKIKSELIIKIWKYYS